MVTISNLPASSFGVPNGRGLEFHLIAHLLLQCQVCKTSAVSYHSGAQNKAECLANQLKSFKPIRSKVITNSHVFVCLVPTSFPGSSLYLEVERGPWNEVCLVPVTVLYVCLQIDRHFMDDWQKQVTEEVHGSELPLVDPVASMRFISSSLDSLELISIEC